MCIGQNDLHEEESGVNNSFVQKSITNSTTKRCYKYKTLQIQIMEILQTSRDWLVSIDTDL